MSNISFGERIRRNRIRNAWSQTELAEKAGVSQMTVSNWETGKATPKPDQRKLALEVLGISKEQSEIKQADIPLEQEQQGPSAFGSWLSRVRLERKMSVGELAIKAGFSPAQLGQVAAGKRPDGLAPDEAIVYDFCKGLLDQRGVEDPAFAAVVAKYGERGVAELVGLMGCYTTACLATVVDRHPPQEGSPRLEPVPHGQRA